MGFVVQLVGRVIHQQAKVGKSDGSSGHVGGIEEEGDEMDDEARVAVLEREADESEKAVSTCMGFVTDMGGLTFSICDEIGLVRN